MHSPSTDDMNKIKLLIISVHDVMNHILTSTKCIEQFQEETSKDVTLAKLKDVFNGLPQRKHHLEPTLLLYLNYRDEISKEHGIRLKDSRIIVPEPMHPEMLQIFHQGHQSQEKFLLHVRETPFWPGISMEVRNIVEPVLLAKPSKIPTRNHLFYRMRFHHFHGIRL